MARQTKKVDLKKFSIEDSPVISENERILDAAVTSRVQTESAPVNTFRSATAVGTEVQNESVLQAITAQQVADNSMRSAKSTEKGITVYVPMDYYKRIRDIKDETGVPIKDLAQRAVIEFVNNYKFRD